VNFFFKQIDTVLKDTVDHSWEAVDSSALFDLF